MADKRISQLIERVDIANNDVLPIVASGATTTNKVTISTIQDWMQENLDVGVTSVGITIGSTGTDVNVTGSPITTSGNITINIPTASATNRGLLSAADWSTFNGKQNSITLTTSGTSGAATLVGSTLNIPNYSTGVANAYVPYVGAIGSVTLGYNSLSASQINIDGASPTGGSYLGFKHSTSVNTGTDGYTSMYTFGTNTIGFQSTSGGTSKAFAFSMVGITAGVPGGRQYTLPDASGTLALTSDLSGYVTLGTAQTITAQKTFTTSGGDDTLIVNHTSGSGIAVDISKAGNGEGLRVAKTSGSGNAVTITGGLLSAEAATLTGALNGTSASFSGNVTSTGGNFRLFNGYYITAKRADGVDINVLGFPAGSNNLTSVTPNDYNLQNTGGQNLFSVSSTGAATFSSSVSVKGGLTIVRSNTSESSVISNEGNLIYNARDNFNHVFQSNGTEVARINTAGAATFSSSVGVGGSGATYSTLESSSTTFGTTVPLMSLAIKDGTYNPRTTISYRTQTGSAYSVVFDSGYSSGWAATNYVFASGNVGIGTSSPSYALDVNGSTNVSSTNFYRYNGDTGIFGSASSITGGTASQLGIRASSDILFATNGANERMRITSGGNVQIGNDTNPYLEIANGGGTDLLSGIRWVIGSGRVNYGGVEMAASSSDNGYIIFKTRNSGSTAERMRITSGGHLLVGNSTDSDPSGSGTQGIAVRGDGILVVGKNGAYAADFGRNTNDGELVRFRRSGSAVGNISVTTTATSYNTSSDYRLKENVKPVKNALSVLTQLKPCTFNFIANEEQEVIGFIAHEVQEVIPQAVTGEKDAVRIEQIEVSPAELDEEGNVITEAVIEEKEVPVYQGIDHSKLVPLLVASIQELKAEIEALKSQING